MASETDNAWAAGIMDGEGYICLFQKQGSSRIWSLNVAVGNTDPRMLRSLQRSFGGKISRDTDKQYAVKRNKPLYRWGFYGRRAKPFLESILPYLVCKKEQAETALAYIETLRPSGASVILEISADTIAVRREMYDSLRALKAEVVK